jgi:hypothetical protein
VKRILIIKLAALGDFVQAFGPFAAIRAYHPESHITLLTTPPYVALALHPAYAAQNSTVCMISKPLGGRHATDGSLGLDRNGLE